MQMGYAQEDWAGRPVIAILNALSAVRRIRSTPTSDADEDLILRAYMSEDFREGLDAFLTKRKPKWKGR